MQETQVWSLGQEDPLEKEMATHSSILAWESHRQRSWQATVRRVSRVGHDLATKTTITSCSLGLQLTSWVLSLSCFPDVKACIRRKKLIVRWPQSHSLQIGWNLRIDNVDLCDLTFIINLSEYCAGAYQVACDLLPQTLFKKSFLKATREFRFF